MALGVSPGGVAEEVCVLPRDGPDGTTAAPSCASAGGGRAEEGGLALAVAVAAAASCCLWLAVAASRSPSLCRPSASASRLRCAVQRSMGCRPPTSPWYWDLSAVMPVFCTAIASDRPAWARLSLSRSCLDAATTSLEAWTCAFSPRFSASASRTAVAAASCWDARARLSAVRASMDLHCFSFSAFHILVSTSTSTASETRAKSSLCRASWELPSSSCTPPTAWNAGRSGRLRSLAKLSACL
mmetsp:Transcript_55601/g.162541  ORF Transcript_55601/g.162541 Transcript_55601/m.162541 type:complete len:242 (+) Transcript_55601:137-862(+)